MPRRSGSRLGRGYRLPRGVSCGDDDGEQRQRRRQLCASGVHVRADGTLARECRARRGTDCPASTAPRSPNEGQTFRGLESFSFQTARREPTCSRWPSWSPRRSRRGWRKRGGRAGSRRCARWARPSPRGVLSRVRRRASLARRVLERDGRDGVPGVRRDVLDAGEDRVVQGFHPVRGSANGREVRRGVGVLLRRGSVQDGDGRVDGVAESSVVEPSAPVSKKTSDRRRSRRV